MSYVLDLEEEEASFLMLQVLANERKGQANAKEIKKLIEDKKLRPWSTHDKTANPKRSGKPYWDQIVQNACDRFDTGRHFYRASFIRIVSTSPDKVLQITDKGRKFVKDLHSFEERLRGKGFALYEYLDKSPSIENKPWGKLKKIITKKKIKYERKNEKNDLLRSLRSREYAKKHHPEYETADIHINFLRALREHCDQPFARSIDAWIDGRNHVGELANMESKQESALAKFNAHFK